jgi:hypothetical protein
MPDPTLAACTPGSSPSPGIGLGGRLAAVVLVVSLAALAGACGSSERTAAPASTSDPTSDPATTPVATTPGATTDEQAAVLATLDHYWVIWLAANSPTDPDDPRLGEVLSGDALKQTQDSMRSRLALGREIQMAPNPQFRHRVEIVNFEGTGIAVATECVVDDTLLVEVSSQRIVNGDVATYELLKTLSADLAGNWTISKSTRQKRWDGVAGCALSA